MRFCLLLLGFLIGSCGSGPSPSSSVVSSVDTVEGWRGMSRDSLRVAVLQVLAGKDARVGVGILDLQRGDTVLVDGDGRFPLMSVAKFPQALCLLHLADSGKFDVGAEVEFRPEDLTVQTGSTIRKDHPGKSFLLSFREVLGYAIGQSDNITANRMFRLEGGPGAVEQYVRSLGIADMGFGTDYFYAGPDAYQKNWSSPRAMLRLMELFYKGGILKETNKALLWEAMLAATSGPDRIRGGVPAGTAVAHKTGTSGRDAARGMVVATNDVGFVRLPDGRWMAVVVFVAESRESDAENAAIIAGVSRVVWAHCVR